MSARLWLNALPKERLPSSFVEKGAMQQGKELPRALIYMSVHGRIHADQSRCWFSLTRLAAGLVAPDASNETPSLRASSSPERIISSSSPRSELNRDWS